MAKYNESVIETARGYYVLEGKTLEQIQGLLSIPLKTLYNWKNKFAWDEDIKNGGGLSIYLEMQQQFVQKIKESMNNGTLTDPGTVDSLWKLAKLLEKMMPQRVMLSNIFKFMEDMVHYFINSEEENEFMSKIHAHIPKLADYLRKKYTND